jgi:predicted nucleic acid-binding protein
VTLVVGLDVNILASAAVSEHGLPRVVLRAGLRRQFLFVTSPHILKKLVDTLERVADRLAPVPGWADERLPR